MRESFRLQRTSCIRLRVIFDVPGPTTLMLLTALPGIAMALPAAFAANPPTVMPACPQPAAIQRITTRNPHNNALSGTRTTVRVPSVRVHEISATSEPARQSRVLDASTWSNISHRIRAVGVFGIFLTTTVRARHGHFQAAPLATACGCHDGTGRFANLDRVNASPGPSTRSRSRSPR